MVIFQFAMLNYQRVTIIQWSAVDFPSAPSHIVGIWAANLGAMLHVGWLPKIGEKSLIFDRLSPQCLLGQDHVKCSNNCGLNTCSIAQFSGWNMVNSPMFSRSTPPLFAELQATVFFPQGQAVPSVTHWVEKPLGSPSLSKSVTKHSVSATCRKRWIRVDFYGDF